MLTGFLSHAFEVRSAAVLSGVCCLAAGVAVIAVVLRGKQDAMAARIGLIRGKRGSQASAGGDPVNGAFFLDKKSSLTLTQQKAVIELAAKIGIPVVSAPAAFAAIRFLAGALSGAGGFFISRYLVWPSSVWVIHALFALVGFAVGYYAPMKFLQSEKTRTKAVVAGLPDALELLAVCVDAGIALESGLQRVSHELRVSQPELSEELSQTWAEINILPSREQALMNFARRVNAPIVQSVVGTLAQTLRFGTPLAQSLRVAAAEARFQQLTALEEKANRLPAMMTLPVMLFIMPTIFAVVGGPAVIKLLDIFAEK